MAIIGTLIKTALELKSKLTPEVSSIEEKQTNQLNYLLSKAKDTAFGKFYDFQGILASADIETEFRKRIPLFDYHEMDEKWWKQQQKYPDITWPGHPDYFALSSGTTGNKSKHIPITNALIASMRSIGLDQLTDFASLDISTDLFEKEILMLSSSANLESNEHGFLEGEISGINVNNFPDWYQTFYRPGKEIAQIKSWDERVDRIAEEAKDWDIGAICGIPSWVLMLLKAIVEKNKLSNIHEIWPSLQVFVSGGVAFAPYKEQFDEIIGSEIFYMDTYLASEGFFGYAPSPKSMEMKLAVNHQMYFEFVPFDEEGFDGYGNILEHPKILTIKDIEVDKEYALIVTTCSGAWRYMIGDTIKFSDVENGLFTISGRTKFYLNVVGSQLSEEKINEAISKASEHFGISIEEFCVGALKDDNKDYYHQWVLGTDDKIDQNILVEFLDNTLQEMNKNYKVARSKALKNVRGIVVTKEKFYNGLSGEKELGGQLKTPKVMKSDKLIEFMNNLNH